VVQGVHTKHPNNIINKELLLMITNEQWQELNNILKRSELIKELAQTEINNNIIWKMNS
jgi:predicted nucleic acid-binding protein